MALTLVRAISALEQLISVVGESDEDAPTSGTLALIEEEIVAVRAAGPLPPDGEENPVWQLTLRRGVDGTTADAHDADTALAFVRTGNPVLANIPDSDGSEEATLNALLDALKDAGYMEPDSEA